MSDVGTTSSRSALSRVLDPANRGRLALLFYAAAVAWFPGAVALVLKRKLLSDEGGGYDLVAAALGLGDGLQLSMWQRVWLYRWDVFLGLVCLPIVWLFLIRPLRPFLRATLTWLLGVLISLVLFVELKSLWEVGTFLPIRVLAAGALGPGRKFAAEYMRSSSVEKLGLLVIAVTGAAILAWWLDRSASGRRAPQLKMSAVAIALVGSLSVIPWIPKTPFDRSAGAMALTEFLGLGASRGREVAIDDATTESLVGDYRALSRAPVPNERSAYFGKAAGYNVLVFIYETLPDACYEDPSSAPALAAFHSLERRAFVAKRHYASYPYSRRAYFSIYSGWYPPHGMRDFTEESWVDVAKLRAPGMVRSAREAGYRTGAYVPELPDKYEGDSVRYQVLGFEHYIVPPNAGSKTKELEDANEARVEWQRPQDDSTLALLRRDIIDAGSRGQRWFFTFNPQLSHGPWPGASKAKGLQQTCATGARVFQHVDSALSVLLATLDSTKQRDRTLIVALGDHGLRTHAEFAGFRGATLDDVTFHVPALIAAPGILDSTVEIQSVTSHIDFAPSVLDLLGISAGRGLEQGSPLWSPGLAGRRVFLFAQGYLGVDGYLDDNESVMLNYMLQGIARSPQGRLQFTPKQVLETSGSAATEIEQVLARATSLQRAFQRRLSAQSKTGTAPGR